jgi:hypothetical protein
MAMVLAKEISLSIKGSGVCVKYWIRQGLDFISLDNNKGFCSLWKQDMMTKKNAHRTA